MDLKKLKYSKCPKCHKHGIPALKKFGHMYNPTVKCKFCECTFSANFALSTIVKIAIPIAIALIGSFIKNWIHIPFWLLCIIILVCYYLIEYFSPLEEEP